MNLPINKESILNQLHENLAPEVRQISQQDISHQDKAKLVNKCVSQQRKILIDSLRRYAPHERGTAALVVQYCCTVASLEYRHFVWPYEYMAFSRRIGELWEAFCKTAWEYPIDPSVYRIDAPIFDDIREMLRGRIENNLTDLQNNSEILDDIEILFDIIGEINMNEDEVFNKADTPHVIDFKSGFGSNEKGNTLRLITVGRAYKIWNPNTRLMLLVRQEENNNYLKVLQRSGIWEVYTGTNAYHMIEEMTGSLVSEVRNNVIDWRADLSPKFYTHLQSQPGNLISYLSW